jgi:glycosyltransferase involved in cell wall biosynthesis
MKKVLIISYYWPPGSGAGVQRWLKFSKYLPEFGWEPVILTVDPEYASYPATDPTLEKDLPAGIKVYRTRATDWFRLYSKDKKKVPSAGFAVNNDNSIKGIVARFVRGNFFIPDPRKGWNKFAIDKAVEIILKEGISHLITSSPPHSTQLLGLELKKIFPGIKWIADLRDPWTDIYYYNEFYPTFIARAVDRKYEMKVLRSSDTIITVGETLKQHFLGKLKNGIDKVKVLTNGYDEEDFRNVSGIIPQRFTISYIGTLSDAYPVYGFLRALEKLKNEGADFIFRLVGSVTSSQQNGILEKIGSERFEYIPYTDHSGAIGYMTSSSLLLMVIPDHHGSRSIVTGKLFEYLASGKPILCLGPTNGDAAAIISEMQAGRTFGHYDESSLYFFLNEALKGISRPLSGSIKSFSRREITGNLVSLLG